MTREGFNGVIVKANLIEGPYTVTEEEPGLSFIVHVPLELGPGLLCSGELLESEPFTIFTL